jgi:hypothetical protein
MNRTASIGVRITPDVKKAAEKAAMEDKRSLASFIEIAIEEKLQRMGYLPGTDSKKK